MTSCGGEHAQHGECSLQARFKCCVHALRSSAPAMGYPDTMQNAPCPRYINTERLPALPLGAAVPSDMHRLLAELFTYHPNYDEKMGGHRLLGFKVTPCSDGGVPGATMNFVVHELAALVHHHDQSSFQECVPHERGQSDTNARCGWHAVQRSTLCILCGREHWLCTQVTQWKIWTDSLCACSVLGSCTARAAGG